MGQVTGEDRSHIENKNQSPINEQTDTHEGVLYLQSSVVAEQDVIVITTTTTKTKTTTTREKGQ